MGVKELRSYHTVYNTHGLIEKVEFIYFRQVQYEKPNELTSRLANFTKQRLSGLRSPLSPAPGCFSKKISKSITASAACFLNADCIRDLRHDLNNTDSIFTSAFTPLSKLNQFIILPHSHNTTQTLFCC